MVMIMMQDRERSVEVGPPWCLCLYIEVLFSFLRRQVILAIKNAVGIHGATVH